MKRITLFSITLILSASFLFMFENCGEDEPAANKPPTVSISSPANNAAIEKGTSVQVSVTASDPDGSISNVQISIDDVNVTTLQSAPYSYTWNTADAAEGQHTIKAMATDDGGLTANSQVTVNLTVTGNTPTVTTADISEITENSATGGGEVTDDGGQDVTARGVVWGDTSEPMLENNLGSTEDGTGTGTFTSSLTELAANTTYYVRAYATNGVGTAYGESKSFTTLAGPPVVTTADISNIDAHLALGGGQVVSDGGGDWVNVGIVWSTSPDPDLNDLESFYTEWIDDNTFEILITALIPETTYYVKAFGTNAYGTSYGDQKTFTASAFTVDTGSFTDSRDSHQYSTITISGQTWMGENLAYLPEVCPSDTECGYWVYDYQGTDAAEAMATTNYSTYGVLYNWEIANAACPTGWHLPSSEEWAIFELNLGMDYQSVYYSVASRGTNEGGKLKETGTDHWLAPNTGATNISGFTALPGGERYVLDGSFRWLESLAEFWTSTTSGSPELNVIFRTLGSSTAQISIARYSKDPYEGNGFSVRCLKD